MNRAPSPQRDEEIEESVDMPMEVYVPAPEMVAMIDKVESIKNIHEKAGGFLDGTTPVDIALRQCDKLLNRDKLIDLEMKLSEYNRLKETTAPISDYIASQTASNNCTARGKVSSDNRDIAEFLLEKNRNAERLKEELTKDLGGYMIRAIGARKIYPIGYNMYKGCRDARTLTARVLPAFNLEHSNYGVNVEGGVVFIESKMALALSCAHFCSKKHLKDQAQKHRLGQDISHPMVTRDSYEATALVWDEWRPVIERMYLLDPSNRELQEILENIAEDDDAGKDLASICTLIEFSGVFDPKDYDTSREDYDNSDSEYVAARAAETRRVNVNPLDYAYFVPGLLAHVALVEARRVNVE